MSGNEVSQILFSIPLSYVGGKGHRPRWMGLGVFMSSLSCFLLASPHLIYGPGEEALSLTSEFYDHTHSSAIPNNITNASSPGEATKKRDHASERLAQDFQQKPGH